MTRHKQRCPHCGRWTKEGTQYCRRCGLQLNTCRECGSFNAWFAEFCHNCGRSMAFAENMTSEGLEKVPFVQSPNPSALDEALLSIIKLRDGTISLSQVSPLLGVSPETLAQSIERLQRFHLIERRK